MSFVPCASCARHVRTNETTCPFCDAALARAGAPRVRDVRGLSRAMLLVGATTLAACGKEPAPPRPDDHSNMQTLYGGPPPQPLDTSAPAPAYGAPPPETAQPVPEAVPPPDAGKADAGRAKN